MQSIEQRLLLTLVVASMIVSGLVAVVVGRVLGASVDAQLDYQLEQIARVLLEQKYVSLRTELTDPRLELEMRVWTADGRSMWRSGSTLAFSPLDATGFADLPEVDGQRAARVLTLHGDDRVVQVAEPIRVRRTFAMQATLQTLLPMLAGAIVLAVVMGVGIRGGLRPLRDLSEELQRRGAQSLGPIELIDAPTELRRPLAMLNELLARLGESLQTHRRFVGDAAHELRTPLAAISLQATNVAGARDAAELDAACTQLKRGVGRAQRVVEQLLTLARVEASGVASASFRRVDLHAMACQCLVELVAVASAKDIQLGLVDDAHPYWVTGDPAGLRTLLDNLVDNAIKYSEVGTSVELELARDDVGVAIRVRDEGPGIPAEARERVFSRFFRGTHTSEPGSGLGLAIVAEIVRSHGGTIVLRDPPRGTGLMIEVKLPHQHPVLA